MSSTSYSADFIPGNWDWNGTRGGIHDPNSTTDASLGNDARLNLTEHAEFGNLFDLFDLRESD
jgi:hypothetical protein